MPNDAPILYTGNDSDESIVGGDNNDSLYGGAGNDTLRGAEGNDYLDGGDGDDFLHSIYGSNTMYGGAGNDFLQASHEADYLDGGEGNDRLIGNSENDTLIGGLGNDTLEAGRGNDLYIMTEEAGAVDIIRHFALISGDDTMDMTGFSNLHAFEELTLVQNGADVEILLANNQKIILSNMLVADITAADFIFTPAPPPELFSAEANAVDLNTVQAADFATGTQTTNALDGDDAVVLADANNWAYTAGTLFSGGAGNDTITGGAQNDAITGAAGDDQLTGGAGTDSFVFTQEAGAADVITDFTSGADVIDLSDASFGAIAVLSDLSISDEAGSARVQLGNGHSLLIAGVTAASLTADDFVGVDADPKPELFSADANIINLNTVQAADFATGTQTTNALDGDDAVVLADANNWAYTAGTLFNGGAGNDTITGGAQNDAITGAAGNDQLTGGAGADSFVFTQETGAADVIVDFTSGADVIDLSDASFGAITVLSDLAIADEAGGARVQLGNGHSVFLAGVAAASLTANDFVGVDADPIPEPDPVTYGTEGNDMFRGSAEADMYNGLGGNDKIYGKDGDDIIWGGSGNDTIDGGNDNDTIYGNAGHDNISGGNGDDAIGGDGGNDVIEGGNGNDSVMACAGNDTVFGDNGDDYLNGEGGDDVLFGGNGDDTLLGGNGNDILHSGNGKDVLNGEAGNDIIYGGNAKDVIIGGSGNDLLMGANGNDMITGGTGKDIMHGGRGKDMFVYESLNDSTDSSRDVIMDFGRGDKIDLSGMGFDGISKGSGEGSTLGYTTSWFSTIITDADSTFSIQLMGQHSLDDGDFIF